MTLKAAITRRVRRRKLKSGEIVEQTRYVLSYRDPRAGKRHQLFFDRQREAQTKAAELVAAFERGSLSTSSKSLTVKDAVDAWLESKRGVVRPITYSTYAFQARYVVATLFPAEVRLATARSGVGARPKATGIELLGREKVQTLTTRKIRAWHKLIADAVSPRAANSRSI